MTSTQDVLDHHLQAFGQGDLAGLLADYDENSKILTNNGSYHGIEEIRGLFEGLLADFGQEGSKMELDHQQVDGETAYIVWHGETPETTYAFCADTFQVQGGVIAAQTFAGMLEPK